MSLIPCDFCHKRVPEKLSQVTWAWYRADGLRVAYRQRLCTTCYCTNLLPVAGVPDFDDLKCPVCGISTNQDMDPCYATAFIPGFGKETFELATCGACAVDVRARAQEGAIKLEKPVGGESQGAGPLTATTRESYWSGIGIIPAGPEA